MSVESLPSKPDLMHPGDNNSMPDPLFREAIERFRRDKTLSITPATLKNYLGAINLFLQYCEEGEWPPSSDDVHSWLSMVKNSTNPKTKKPISKSTVHNYWATLRMFFNYCEAEGLVSHDQNPIKKIKAKKIEPKKAPLNPVATPEGDIITLLNYLKDKAENGTSYKDRACVRDYVIILFLFVTGVRANEMVTMRLNDVDMLNNVAYVRPEGSKRGEGRAVPLDDMLCSWIKRWLNFRDDNLPDAENYLFVSYRGRYGSGKGMKPTAINQMLKKHGAGAGIPHSSTHKYRHAFAIGSLRAGINLKYVQLAMGHKTPDMTIKFYQRVLDEEHLRVYREESLSKRLIDKGNLRE